MAQRDRDGDQVKTRRGAWSWILPVGLSIFLLTGCGGSSERSGGPGGSGEAFPSTGHPVLRLDEIPRQIQRAFNEQDYATIHGLFNAEMARITPVEKVARTCSELRGISGPWTSIESVRTYRGRAATFTGRFERGQWDFAMMLDEEGRIDILDIALSRSLFSLPTLDRNAKALSLPFNGDWTVESGGDTEELNSLKHLLRADSSRAFDFEVRDETGKTRKDSGSGNEAYLSWSREVLAPGDGTVVEVVDGIEDNTPGWRNRSSSGNAVCIQHSDREFSLLLHLKCGSIRVKRGDPVVRGGIVGLCGNSGNSLYPHLHYQLMNSSIAEVASGIKVFFERVHVTRDGKPEERRDYSPIKGDVVSP
jgi:hypothetical protein